MTFQHHDLLPHMHELYAVPFQHFPTPASFHLFWTVFSLRYLGLHEIGHFHPAVLETISRQFQGAFAGSRDEVKLRSHALPSYLQ